jgi:tRNA threonylcarbamoyladenosine biosynthesis protein TsaE
VDETVLTYRSTSTGETEAIAHAVGKCLRPGDIVLLHGPLGAGKTAFVRGAARALGVRGRVRSPTFVFVNMYPGNTPVVHADLFRVPRGEGEDLGLEDLANGDVVSFIEWAERSPDRFPGDVLDVDIRLDADDGEGRTIVMRARGPRSAAILSRRPQVPAR